MRLLDLFCGAGGAGTGYGLSGWDVTGVDIKPQKHYPQDGQLISFGSGPDGLIATSIRFVQMDAMDILEGKNHGGPAIGEYDLVHASPPCQVFTRAKHLREAQGREATSTDLLTPTLARLIDLGIPYIVENVPGAPLRKDVVLCGSMFNLKVRRHRWFQTNLPLAAPRLCDHKRQGKPVGVYHRMGDTAQGRSTKTGKWVVGGSTAKTMEEASAAMGIGWMVWSELKEAIPPSYTYWLGLRAGSILTGGASLNVYWPAAGEE